MRISRFYYSDVITVDAEITLPDDLTHYISNVLRAKVGQPIVLFNGNGCDYPCEIIEAQKRKITVLVNSQISLQVESPAEIHLAQCISKGDRMDYALQKAVELGVSQISPILSENCNVKLNDARWEKKVEQWQKIVISACEQSGRNFVPHVNMPISFNQLLATQTGMEKIILAPGATHYLSGVKKNSKGFLLTIGPEGGFTDQEVYNAQQRGFMCVNLGPRILRTETATVVAMSILQSLHGDI
ncbi:16S rRNA (uracil(1498)-N(3))-methyltransferase [Glaciecola sp. 1036]|uniref:16S rRNA (uracil(1498)-N(3))-methyltransferase n=1 Tax=Alteromonadaceae TaxID=72275 RepID=UPI003D02D1BC